MNLRLNSVYISIGGIIRLFISLVSVPMLVRFMGLDRYGVWIVLNSVINLTMMLELGISTALTNLLSAEYAVQERYNAHIYISTSFILMTVLGCLSSLGVLLSSPFLGRFLFKSSPYLKDAQLTLVIFAVYLLMRFWQLWIVAIEAALFRFDIQASIETISTIAVQIVILWLALSGGQLWELALCLFVGSATTLVGHYLFLRYKRYPVLNLFRFSGSHARLLIHFGFVQWISSIGSNLFGYADRIIVNVFLGSAAAGLYSALTSVASKINEISAMPLRVLPPAISSAKASDQTTYIQQNFLWATRLNSLVVFLVASSIIFWSNSLARFLVPSQLAIQTAKMLQILAIAYGLYSLNASGFFIAVGLGHPIINARWAFAGGGMFCIVLVVFLPWLGLMGAVLANFSYILTLMINIQVMRILRIKVATYIKVLFPAIAILLTWYFACNLLSNLLWPIWVQGAVFIALQAFSLIFIVGKEFLKGIAINPGLWIRKKFLIYE